jgi:hypothetical protein
MTNHSAPSPGNQWQQKNYTWDQGHKKSESTDSLVLRTLDQAVVAWNMSDANYPSMIEISTSTNIRSVQMSSKFEIETVYADQLNVPYKNRKNSSDSFECTWNTNLRHKDEDIEGISDICVDEEAGVEFQLISPAESEQEANPKTNLPRTSFCPAIQAATVDGIYTPCNNPANQSDSLNLDKTCSSATTIPEMGFNNSALKDAFQAHVSALHNSARTWRKERSSEFSDDTDDNEERAASRPSPTPERIGCFPKISFQRRGEQQSGSFDDIEDDIEDDIVDEEEERRPRACGLAHRSASAAGGRETFLGRAARALRESFRGRSRQ